jgi:hypothetical protein
VKRLEFVLCLLVVGSALVFGQATATINGRVVDPAEAVVPNATVTVTNVGTGVARDSVTNAEGLYSVPALTPGNYDVKVKAQGFETADRASVELLTGGTLSVDFKMTVGAVQQSVEVGAQAALVETSQAVGSESIRQQEVDALPQGLEKSHRQADSRPIPWSPSAAAQGTTTACSWTVSTTRKSITVAF